MGGQEGEWGGIEEWMDERERWVTGQPCINRPVGGMERMNARLAEMDALQLSFSADRPN